MLAKGKENRKCTFCPNNTDTSCVICSDMETNVPYANSMLSEIGYLSAMAAICNYPIQETGSKYSLLIEAW